MLIAKRDGTHDRRRSRSRETIEGMGIAMVMMNIAKERARGIGLIEGGEVEGLTVLSSEVCDGFHRLDHSTTRGPHLCPQKSSRGNRELSSCN